MCAHNFQKRPIGGGSAYIFCDGIDAYYDEVRKKGADVKFKLTDEPYGMRDFTVADPDGNYLNFGSESEKSKPSP